MILECTECRTRYLVPDSAIGPEGRTVRCASCKHSWFQGPAEVLDLTQAAPDASAAAPRQDRVRAAAPAPVAAAKAPAADVDPDFDAFAHQPPFKPRRNPARRWTVAALAAGTAMLIGVGGMIWSGAPGFATQFGLFTQPADVPLRIEQFPIDRRDLDSGSELFAVSGRIVNPTNTRQSVPDIRAELRDAQGRIVYSWTITPERRTLGPRGSLDFHSAQLDVPGTSKRLDFSFASAPVG